MATIRFQCPECDFGDYEVGHLVTETEVRCIVCLEEQGQEIRVECWEAAPTQARLRLAAA